jgi:hypothetical protein
MTTSPIGREGVSKGLKQLPDSPALALEHG